MTDDGGRRRRDWRSVADGRRRAAGGRGRRSCSSVPVSRVHQMVRDGQLLSVRRDGAVCVPSDFFDGSAPVKGLSGTIMLLRDGGYDDPDILRWLFADDDSLPGSPIAVAARRPAPRGQAARPGDGVLTVVRAAAAGQRRGRRPGTATAARRRFGTATRRCSTCVVGPLDLVEDAPVQRERAADAGPRHRLQHGDARLRAAGRCRGCGRPGGPARGARADRTAGSAGTSTAAHGRRRTPPARRAGR